MTILINQPSICFICRCRSSGVAVGRAEKLAWFCSDCGVHLAKEAYQMAKDFDVYEERAAQKVAELCGLSQVTLTKDELPEFVTWAVKEFGDALRTEVEGGKAPF